MRQLYGKGLGLGHADSALANESYAVTPLANMHPIHDSDTSRSIPNYRFQIDSHMTVRLSHGNEFKRHKFLQGPIFSEALLGLY
jgi:hypothetical protein